MNRWVRPTISVIIPTKNRPDSLRMVLSSLSGQKPSVDEIVVIDTGTGSAARESRRVTRSAAPARSRYYRLSGASASSARNYGIAKSSGSILAFLDDDTVPEAGWHEAVQRAARVGRFWFRGLVTDASESRGVVHDLYAFYRDLTVGDLRSRWAASPSYRGYRMADLLPAGNFFVHRTTAEEMRPFFDERTFPFLAEGTDLSLRVRSRGGQILEVPGASVRHLFLRLGFTSFVIEEPFWYGRASAIFARRSTAAVRRLGSFGTTAWKSMRTAGRARMLRLMARGIRLYRTRYAKSTVHDVAFLSAGFLFGVSWLMGYAWGLAEYARNAAPPETRGCA